MSPRFSSFFGVHVAWTVALYITRCCLHSCLVGGSAAGSPHRGVGGGATGASGRRAGAGSGARTTAAATARPSVIFLYSDVSYLTLKQKKILFHFTKISS